MVIENPLRPLRVFLCYSSGDKKLIRDLYQRLCVKGIAPWFDEKDLLPGQDWDQEIAKAVRASDIVIVCLSRESINRKGYVQKEIKYALDVADEQPENTIFLIPLRLESCEIPNRLHRWHWVNLFEEDGFERLMKSLRHRSIAATTNEQSKKDKAPGFLTLEIASIEEKNIGAIIEILKNSIKTVHWMRLDKDSNNIEMSDSFASLLGISIEDMKGAAFMDIVAPEEKEKTQRQFEYRMTKMSPIYYFTELQDENNRDTHRVGAYSFPILNEGLYVGAMAIVIPVDEI
jgi:PAS domain S-box-containing protein